MFIKNYIEKSPNKPMQRTWYALSICVHVRRLSAPRGVKQLAAESAAMKVLPVTSFIES